MKSIPVSARVPVCTFKTKTRNLIFLIVYPTTNGADDDVITFSFKKRQLPLQLGSLLGLTWFGVMNGIRRISFLFDRYTKLNWPHRNYIFLGGQTPCCWNHQKFWPISRLSCIRKFRHPSAVFVAMEVFFFVNACKCAIILTFYKNSICKEDFIVLLYFWRLSIIKFSDQSKSWFSTETTGVWYMLNAAHGRSH